MGIETQTSSRANPTETPPPRRGIERRQTEPDVVPVLAVLVAAHLHVAGAGVSWHLGIACANVATIMPGQLARSSWLQESVAVRPRRQIM
jgi:hypothetical protein